jgi:hypothetical protein
MHASASTDFGYDGHLQLRALNNANQQIPRELTATNYA